MKLLNSLYHVTSVEESDEGAVYNVKIDFTHTIYKSHFPDFPITPGVCVAQMAQELLAHCLRRPLTIKKVLNAKFLAALTPTDDIITVTLRKISIDNGIVRAQAQVASPSVVYAKVSMLAVEREDNG